MKHLDVTKAIVSLSGGQDSTTTLAKAIDTFGEKNVLAVIFDYGQKHRIEIACAQKIASLLNVEHIIIKTDILSQIGDSALVTGGDVNAVKDGLPASFVPGRNLFFLNILAAVAYKNNAANIFMGVCQTDFSGYPDCRQRTLDIAIKSLDLGMATSFTLHTPLMDIDKAQTFKLANDLDVLDLVLNETMTCYNGDAETMNPWGKGCGDCPACDLRKKGYDKATEEKMI